jgi:hypothetical protein
MQWESNKISALFNKDDDDNNNNNNSERKKEITRRIRQCMDSSFRNMDNKLVDVNVEFLWLRKGELEEETENLVICTQ